MSQHKRGIHPHDPKRLTQDQFSIENSVGDLVARHRLGASLHDPSATRQPIWGDFTSVDFQRYQDTIIDVQRNFDALPARVRREFGNDPRQVFRLMDKVHVGDSSAVALALKLGIVTESAVPDSKPDHKPDPKPDPSQLKSDPESNPNKVQ